MKYIKKIDAEIITKAVTCLILLIVLDRQWRHKKTFSINSKFKKAYIRKLTNDKNPKARRSSHVALKKAWEIKPPMLSYITILY